LGKKARMRTVRRRKVVEIDCVVLDLAVVGGIYGFKFGGVGDEDVIGNWKPFSFTVANSL
jgi:hypothetical protein